MKQKIFLFLALMANTVLFAQTFTSGGINYTVTSTTAPLTVAVGNNQSFSGAAVIPATIIYAGNTHSVTVIDTDAFNGCTGLTSISIPSSITTINNYVFLGCTGLTSVSIPSSVTAIGVGAFQNCTGLTSVSIPSSVTAINTSVFRSCTGLTSVSIPSSVTAIGSFAFRGCTGLTSVSIPSSVTDIGGSSFRDCTSLTSVSIPNSVTSIGNSVFFGCTSLISVTVNWTSPITINANVFENVALANVTLNIPEGTLAAYQAAAVWQDFSNIGLPTPVVQIGDTFTADGINYAVTALEPLEVAVGNNQGFSGAAVIPETVTNNGNTFTVTSIINTAFVDCTGLTFATIGNSVTAIGTSAFYGCTSLTSVTIGNSVTSIGSQAFYNCTGLTSITIPDSVTTLMSSAFYGCTGLTSVTIPNSITTIAPNAFYGCTSLTTVTIPDSITTIGNAAFRDCTGLTSVTIPNSVTLIDFVAFYNCTSLTSVTIPSSITSIGDFTFFGCTSLNSVTVNWTSPVTINANVFGNVTLANVTLNIPEGTLAAYQAAAVWQDFSNIGLPAPVVQIGDTFTADGINYVVTALEPLEVAVGNNQGFSGAAVIPESVTNNGNTYAVTSIAQQAFQSCTGLTLVTIPDSVTTIGVGAFSGCASLTSVAIPDFVTTIGSSAFENCIGLVSVSIPNSVTSISNFVFIQCSSLTSITIPDSVTTIGLGAFADCSGLTTVTMGNSVTTIGVNAFRNCTSLTSLSIPNSVASIGSSAFYGCTSLTSITIPDSVTSIGSYAFFGCTGFTLVSIPNSVTSLGDYAFYGCTGLTSVSIPNSITAIGNGVFGTCSGLTSVTIPNSVTSFGDSAFESCTNLTSVAIPDSVTSIGNATFSYCTSLISITIPNSVTSIGNFAFRNCTSLTSVSIPDSVTSIGDNAFFVCTSLTSVTVNWASPITIEADVFQDVTVANVVLNIPSGTLAAYQAAPVWQDFLLTEPEIVPTFAPVEAICAGSTLADLPTTSTNNISGTWSPALNNMETTTYTFTPNDGQNATTATLTIVVLGASEVVWGKGSSNTQADANGRFASPFNAAGSWQAVSNFDTDGSVVPGNAFWTRSLTGTGQGGYFGTLAPMGSPTQSDGVALFDSDFLDNNGTTGAFGSGSSPANHSGDLISPSFDLTAFANQTIKASFHLYYRNFNISELSIGYSSDGGATWTNIDILQNVAAQQIFPTTQLTYDLPNFTSGANLTNCKIRFRFNGNYYFAMIDDVTLFIEGPVATVPTFDPIQPICYGSTATILPTISNNGIEGTWSPELNSEATTVYTFTPAVGLCATTTTLEIIVNQTDAPTASSQEFCGSATVADLVVDAQDASNSIENNDFGTLDQFSNPTINWYDVATGGVPLESTAALTSGTYYVSRITDGCESERVAVEVTVYEATPAPFYDGTLIFNDGTTLSEIEVAFIPDANIQWYVLDENNNFVAVESSTLIAATTYYVSQSLNNCESQFLAIEVESVLSNDGFDNQIVSVYPNPVSERLFISGIENIENLQVVNVLGQIIYNRNQPNEAAINVTSFEKGTYLLRISQINGASKIIRFVKN